MAGDSIKIFGFELSRPKSQKVNTQQSFIPPDNSDGAITIAGSPHYSTYVDMDGTSKNEIELITRYREMAMQPELESAIDDICNEAIVKDDDGNTIKLVLDRLKDVPDKIKKQILEEFQTILRMLNYQNMSQEIFRRWYVDGRIHYQIMLDKDNPSSGIQELRYIDPRKIKKVRELKKIKDANTNADIVNVANEYYVYNDKIMASGTAGQSNLPGVKITKDSIVTVNSGLMDARRATVLSYLHKAIKPLNQLRMIEDATVIYRVSRAPERRIFYIDVGNLPKLKAEQYLNDIMTKYKNKTVYDSQTGQVRDDRKNLSMLEDFWLPRREGGKGTEITTLQGGANLGVMEDVIYFEKKLYKSLSVPIGRLDPQEGFSLGKTDEISRDEIKFDKFIQRLRSRFSDLFDQILRVQLTTRGICSLDEWELWKEKVHFDFIHDNYFSELKEAQVMTERLSVIQLLDPYTGRFFSNDWVRKKVLRMSDDEIKQMKEEIDQERKDDEILMAGNPQEDVPQNQEQPLQQDQIHPDDQSINNHVSSFGQ